MSNLYSTEPVTTGKVIVESTLGDIEIELWCKEAPKACRNFLGLCLEGYYDGLMFHRIVPGFIAQTGDPTGTGSGGESFFGEPFENEVHPRLRFNRRGLVGMANNDASGGHDNQDDGDGDARDTNKGSNTSQWFITLDRTPELQRLHTLFGRITGPTIYNVLKMDSLTLDPRTEKPLDPPIIHTIRIIENPFEDLVPRITRAERIAQMQARVEAAKEREQREWRKKAGKKNTGLLSFGEEAEAEDEGERDAGQQRGEKVVAKKTMARMDCEYEAYYLFHPISPPLYPYFSPFHSIPFHPIPFHPLLLRLFLFCFKASRSTDRPPPSSPPNSIIHHSSYRPTYSNRPRRIFLRSISTIRASPCLFDQPWPAIGDIR